MQLTLAQFNKLATNKNLEATNKNLEELRQETKKEFKELRQEIDRKFDAAFDLFATKEDIKELRQEMATKADIDRVLNAMDMIIKKHQDFDIELTANQGAHDRFEEKFVKSDKKIEILEKQFKTNLEAI